MEAVRPLPMSVDDYLAFEESSAVRHEYIGGEVHAMAGESVAHNTIAGNIFALLRGKLRGGPCRVFFENVKLRLEVAHEDVFYYPDVVVSCQPTGIERLFVRLPTVVVEVLSPSTENTDRREKKLSYQQIATLEEYAIVAQDRREVTLFRRANAWVAEIHTMDDAAVEFRSVGQAMTVAEIYEDVVLSECRAPEE
jgi:Uma2 family endonuclease